MIMPKTPASHFSLLTHAFLFLLAIFFCIPHFSHSHCTTSPIIFNFGDSNSDTGGLFAGLGYPVNLPNGRTFFRRSTGRLSDGRLLIDFLCNFLLFIFLLFLYYLVNFGSQSVVFLLSHAQRQRGFSCVVPAKSKSQSSTLIINE